MILGAIADDFTGAGDLAGILAELGMRTTLLTDLDAEPSPQCEAIVIALKTRSIARNSAVAQSLAALKRLRALGCRQILFKYCSTFDSTPNGNIGPVAEALADALGAQGAVVCPAFPANGRTVYQGNLFVGDVPLSESSMRDHPLTPMTDSDIRRWLARQTSVSVGHLPLSIVRAGADDIRAALALHEGLVVVDAIDDNDLLTIGAALSDAVLITGGSAVAQGLPRNYRRAGLIGEGAVVDVRSDGPAIVLAGSCSVATCGQIERYRRSHPAVAIDVARLAAGEPIVEEVDAFLQAHADSAPLAYSTANGKTSGVADIAERIEELIAELSARAVARCATRIVIAGGETSGAVVSRLNVGSLEVGRMVAPGVPLLKAGALGFALKSGNFGGEDFFAEAVTALGGSR